MHNIIVPIPKPGDRVSFPVACVTGVCFSRFGDNDRWRWNVEKSQLENWLENKWHSVSGAVVIDGTVTVVEEPKPEPVWKDCNFIEAWEHMNGGGEARVDGLYPSTTYTKTMNKSLYSLNVNGQFKLNISNIFKIGAIIEGKWQIKV